MKRIVCWVLAAFVSVVAVILSSCGNSAAKQQKIMDTFSSFENSEKYIIVTEKEVHIGKKVIEWDSIVYNGAPCFFIVTEEDGAYAYSYDTQVDNSINIVYVDYETLETRLLANLELPNRVIRTELFDNSLYFRVDDPHDDTSEQFYYIYNLLTKEIKIVGADSLLFDIERAGDHNRSLYFNIETEFSGCFNVTRKDTGESKRVDKSLLMTCEEGRKIIELGRKDLGAGCSHAFEKDGCIYVLFLYVTDGTLGDPCHQYIMKYDFDSHTFEYYTSIFFDKYPEMIYDLYIP